MGTRKALIDIMFFLHALGCKNQIYGPIAGQCDTRFIQYQFILYVGEDLVSGDGNSPHFDSVEMSYKDYHPFDSSSHSTTSTRVEFLVDLIAARQKLLIKTGYLGGTYGETPRFSREGWCYFVSHLSTLDSYFSLISSSSQK